MQLTTKGCFAVTAMMDIALHGSHRPVTLAHISEWQKISLSYLEQLFGKLRRSKLVNSALGPADGYRLAKPMSKVSAVDSILSVDEPVDATQCKEKKLSQWSELHVPDLWANLNVRIRDYLALITLEQLATNPKIKNIAVLQDLPRCYFPILFWHWKQIVWEKNV